MELVCERNLEGLEIWAREALQCYKNMTIGFWLEPEDQKAPRNAFRKYQAQEFQLETRIPLKILLESTLRRKIVYNFPSPNTTQN